MKPSAVTILIGVNVAVFLLQVATHNALDGPLALWPLQPLEGAVYFRFWQLITYAFLHGNFAHIFFNMWMLWVCGAEIERYLGAQRFLTCYFASVLTAALSQLYVPIWFHAEPSPVVGASGGVFGLILVFAVMFPHRKILLFMALPMPMWLFAAGYAFLELYLGVTNSQSSVAHFAHLGGMIGSGIVLAFWARSRSGNV